MGSSSEDILKNIGNRLKKQHSSAKAEKDEKQEEETVAAETRADNETSSDQTAEKEDQELLVQEETSDEETETASWSAASEHYFTSFRVNSKTDRIFDEIRLTFKRELNIKITKQKSIELGLKLLDNLDPKFFAEVRATCSPEDNLIEALKDIIDEHY